MIRSPQNFNLEFTVNVDGRGRVYIPSEIMKVAGIKGGHDKITLVLRVVHREVI